MQLLININKEDYELMKHNVAVDNPLCPLGEKEMVTKIANSTPIPEGATNGDVVKVMFPNARVVEIYPSFNGDEVYYVLIKKFNGITNEMRVLKSWWNEPYKKSEK